MQANLEAHLYKAVIGAHATGGTTINHSPDDRLMFIRGALGALLRIAEDETSTVEQRLEAFRVFEG